MHSHTHSDFSQLSSLSLLGIASVIVLVAVVLIVLALHTDAIHAAEHHFADPTGTIGNMVPAIESNW